MARENEGCREIFSALREEGHPLALTQAEAASLLKMSVRTLQRKLDRGQIKRTGNLVSLWSIAKFLS